MLAKLLKLFAIFAAAIVISALIFLPVQAADTRTGEKVIVGAGEVVNDDLYLAGSEVNVDGKVNGDIIAVGNKVIINGEVNGSVIAAGSIVTVNGRIANAVRAAGNKIFLNGKTGRDLVAMAASVSTSTTSEIGLDLLAYAGIINISGPIDRNVVCGANRLVVASSIQGKVIAKANEVRLEAPAIIEGDLEYSSAADAVIAPGARVRGKITNVQAEKAAAAAEQTVSTAISAVVSTVMAFILGFMIIIFILTYAAALLTGVVLIFISRRYLAEVLETLRTKFWPCLGWGALMAVIVPIAASILCMVLVGIPLAVAILALFIIALYIGHIITAILLGKWLLRMLAKDETIANLIGALALGLLVIYILAIIPFLGVITSLAAVLFGFGAIVYYIKSKLTCGRQG